MYIDIILHIPYLSNTKYLNERKSYDIQYREKWNNSKYEEKRKYKEWNKVNGRWNRKINRSRNSDNNINNKSIQILTIRI